MQPETRVTRRDASFLERITDPWFRDIVQVQDLLSASAHRFFRSRGLININLPSTTGSISSPMGLGSDSTPVEIQIGGVKIYLADSMQFLLEYGCRLHPGGCFYIAPSFRGDTIDDTHLQQFFHLEAEICGGEAEAAKLLEDFLISFSGDVLSNRQRFTCLRSFSHIEAMAALKGFPSLTYDEALGLLSDVPGAIEKIANTNLSKITRLGERALMAEKGAPVWLTAPPAAIVPFYQASGEGASARCRDLLLGVGEVCGLGERHVDGQSTRSAIVQHGLSPTAYDWYVELKSSFPLETSGFGVGVERLLCWLFDEDDIRSFELIPRKNDAVMFP